MAELSKPYVYDLQYLMLPLHVFGFPTVINLGITPFQVKTEFHATIIAARSIITQIMTRDHLGKIEAESVFKEAAFPIVNQLRPFITTIGPELRLVDQPTRGRRTIIAMATIENLEAVFVRLGQALALTIPATVGHITFATFGAMMGIAIPDAETLKALSRPLEPAELAQLSTQFNLETLYGATA